MEARHNHYMDNSYYPDCPRCKLNEAAPETKEQRDELLEAAQFALDAFGQSYSQESEAKARLRAIIAKCEKG